MIVYYILLIVGFGLLIKGADWFVEGSARIASSLRVPPLLIGLTIVAFGTSSPETTVSIIAAINGSSDIALGNVIGSNIFNITLVIGITALIAPLAVENETIRKEIPFMLLASVVLLVLVGDMFLDSYGSNIITRTDGIIFLLFFCIFMYYIFEVARNNRTSGEQVQETSKSKWGRNILFTLLGLAAIILGGDFVVRSSKEIAYAFGMSEILVGLTIVAVGTSLPELVTSITAALKKQTDIASI